MSTPLQNKQFIDLVTYPARNIYRHNRPEDPYISPPNSYLSFDEFKNNQESLYEELVRTKQEMSYVLSENRNLTNYIRNVKDTYQNKGQTVILKDGDVVMSPEDLKELIEKSNLETKNRMVIELVREHKTPVIYSVFIKHEIEDTVTFLGCFDHLHIYKSLENNSSNYLAAFMRRTSLDFAVKLGYDRAYTSGVKINKETDIHNTSDVVIGINKVVYKRSIETGETIQYLSISNQDEKYTFEPLVSIYVVKSNINSNSKQITMDWIETSYNEI